MRTPTQFAIRFILFLCLVTPGVAQDNRPVDKPKSALTISAIASTDRVRFAGPSSVVQIRLEVYNSAGKKLSDNEVRGGNVVDWLVQDGAAERLADDTYLCVVTVKSLSGSLTQKIGSVTVEKTGASLNAVNASELTAQQAEAIGPLEEQASLVVLKEDDRRTPTVIAHNGEEGQIVRGRGALSFRIGDFFKGNDTEQMRLTTEGNLGIGITHPQVRLDVDGQIRANQGIVFPDGSVQFSAAKKTFGFASLMPGQSKHTLAQGQEHQSPDTSGTGTTNKIPKWLDGPTGVLSDSDIFDAPCTYAHCIGIGAMPAANSPFKLDVRGHNRFAAANVSFYMTGEGNNEWVFQTVDADRRLRFFDNRGGGERLSISQAGNVGIGVATPVAKLHVKGAEEGIMIQGPAADNANVAYMSFFDSAGTRIGYVGDGSIHEKNIYLASDLGDVALNTSAGRVLTATPDGRVGIGTTNPTLAKLQVDGGADGSGVGVYGAIGTGYGLYGASDGVGVLGQGNFGAGVIGSSISGDLIKGQRGPGIGGETRFRVETNGIVHAPAYQGLPDFAEAIRPSPSDKSRLEPGDVLVAASNTDRSVTRSRKPYSTSVLGVYSTAPGFIGTENPIEGASSETIPMAVIGIVPCKVSAENGPIRRGDLLTSSRTPGHAMRCADRRRCSGAIVGKALAAFSNGLGVIKVLVTLQ